MEALQGARELERKLKHLQSQGSKKVARAAVTGMVGPIRKGIRQQVNATPATTELRRAARKAVGSKVKKQPDGSYGAKAGLGVGKMTKKQRASASARAAGGQGVGVSKHNIHWFVLGTTERTQTSTGKSVGRIKPVFKGVVPRAVTASTPAAIAAGAEKARKQLKKEAKTRR